ncbi:MAG: STAS domain-containing protein [Planctomycetota bacterium]|nr:STAS domain-containing protein [Planctomycetota bacterium]MDA1164655.1 STAS domain-containing protein [Planctomycetota bacterium]
MPHTTTYDYDTANGYVVVSFNPSLADCRWGDIEQVGTEIKQQLVALDRPVFFVDLTRLEYMGSSMVALIVKLWKTTQEKNGDMVVVNNSMMIGEVLEIAGLARIWNIVDSREAAEKLLGVGRFGPASPMSRFFLAILGWVMAAGAQYFVVAPQKQLIVIDPKTAQILVFTCGGIAVIAGLVAAIRDQRVWRLLGILLVIVATGVVVAAAVA